jgi:hypothetical protein
VWLSATVVSSCGVLVGRGNRQIYGLHWSSQVSVHLSTCDWILCTGCKVDWFILFCPTNAQYILRIFASYSTHSCLHVYKYYSFVGQIQLNYTKYTVHTARWIVFVSLVLSENYKKKQKDSRSWSMKREREREREGCGVKWWLLSRVYRRNCWMSKLTPEIDKIGL